MRKLASDTLVVSVAGLVSRLKGLVFIPVIVGAIGFGSYGAFVQIFATVRLFTSLSTFELGMGFQRFASKIPNEDVHELSRHFSSVVLPLLLLGSLGGLLLYAASETLSELFFEGGELESLRLAAVVVVSNAAFSAVRSYLRARRRFKQQSILSLCHEVLPYVGFVVAAAISEELYHGVATYAALDVGISFVSLLLCCRGLRWRTPSLSLTKRYLRYTFPLSLSVSQGSLLARGDLYFISFFLGLDAVATYNIAYRFAEIIRFVGAPIDVQLLTYLARPWDQGRVEQSRHLIRHISLIFLMLTMGMIPCFALYLDSVFALLLHAPDVPRELPMIALFIGLGLLANAFRRFLYLIIRLERATRHEFFYQLVGLSVNVLSNLLLIPRYGILGAAFATFLTYTVMLPLIGARYSLGVDRAFVLHTASFALLALVVILVRLGLPPDTLGGLVLSAGMAYLSYLVLAALVNWSFLASLRAEVSSWQALLRSEADSQPSGAA